MKLLLLFMEMHVDDFFGTPEVTRIVLEQMAFAAPSSLRSTRLHLAYRTSPMGLAQPFLSYPRCLSLSFSLSNGARSLSLSGGICHRLAVLLAAGKHLSDRWVGLLSHTVCWWPPLLLLRSFRLVLSSEIWSCLKGFLPWFRTPPLAIVCFGLF